MSMEANTDKNARVRIEDMTLGQINGLKKEIADELKGYLAELAKIVSDRFDVGAIGFSVDTELVFCEIKHESPVKYDINIHFSKEDL